MSTSAGVAPGTALSGRVTGATLGPPDSVPGLAALSVFLVVSLGLLRYRWAGNRDGTASRETGDRGSPTTVTEDERSNPDGEPRGNGRTTEHDSPVPDHESPAAGPSSPAAGPSSPAAGPSSPAADHESPVPARDGPAAGPDSPVADNGRPAAERDSPVAERDGPAAGDTGGHAGGPGTAADSPERSTDAGLGGNGTVPTADGAAANGASPSPAESVDPSRPVPSEQSGASSASARLLETDSDEERVFGMLERNDGNMKQARIVEETDWSKSKVSTLLSEMDENDTITKLRLGRENVIFLDGEEPELALSPDDERGPP